MRNIGAGGHFGELALISNEPRSLSVRAKNDQCKLLSLNKATFLRILGNIQKYLKRDYSKTFSVSSGNSSSSL